MGPLSEHPLLDWGVASMTLPGQTDSGDLYVVKPFENGALVGVIDGLGHGNEAALAARAAVKALEAHADQSILKLIRWTHEDLKKTRGAVMSIASFNATENTMAWLGVGNVEGFLFRGNPKLTPPQEVILLRAGVVGFQLPELYVSVHPVSPGDTLVFTTDGIRSEFQDFPRLNHDSPKKMAEKICAQKSKGTDDALVLVARYLGKKL